MTVTEPEKKRRIPRHLWWGVGVPLVLVIVGVFRLPELHRQWMAGNEDEATAALMTLAFEEADFHSYDRNTNRVDDYWTADVAGLWPESQFMERGIAEADANPLMRLVNEPVPYHGYYFVALDRDLRLRRKYGGDGIYRTDTDHSGRKIHSMAGFGFCAFPASPGWTGSATFIINENGMVFSLEEGGKPVKDWPADDHYDLTTLWKSD